MNIYNNKILLAGPWVGELGWELFCWQAHIRWLSKNFDKTIVITRKGNDFLYKDFANEIYFVDAPSSKINMWIGQPNQKQLISVMSNLKYTQHLRPFNIGFGIVGNNNFTGSDIFFNQQKFVKYKSNTLDKTYDIILHPRNKIVGNNRNWTKENFQKLVDLLKNSGYIIGVIGTDEAYKLDGVDDYRNRPMEDTVALMTRSKLVIGQSSGPLHLASLSGVPHFVWSDETNRKRYNDFWNPHKTKCYFYNNGGWNPKVENLHNEIKNILS